jgi:hypothetical protein
MQCAAMLPVALQQDVLTRKTTLLEHLMRHWLVMQGRDSVSRQLNLCSGLAAQAGAAEL